MRTLILVAISVLISFSSSALKAQQLDHRDFGFKQFVVHDDSLGNLYVYVSAHEIDVEKPILFYLEGSSPLPMYYSYKTSKGNWLTSSGVVFDSKVILEKYHLAFVTRPGIPFHDTLSAESGRDFKSKYPVPDEFYRKNSLDWRVKASKESIQYLLKTLPVKNNDVFAVGYSEGGQIVSALAAKDSSITKVVNIVGGGLNHFYDVVIEMRTLARLGEMSHQQAQDSIESLFSTIQKIYANKDDVSKIWWGETYRKWESITRIDPVEYLSSLEIPILLIAGSNDSNAQILGLDYNMIEFLRLGKTNLTYKVFTGSDHYFYNESENKDYLPEMVKYMLDWLDKEVKD